MALPLGLILDVGHVGKPAPDHRDRGATAEGRVEADIALRYVLSAEAYAGKLGVAVHVIQPGPAGMKYSERHREAVQVAQRDRTRRWLYAQCHLNSAERDPRYGLVGYDPRSAAGKRAAELLSASLAVELVGTVDRARAEAAEGDWSRMMSTIAGIYAGPGTLSGVCFEPCFIQSRTLEQADMVAKIGRALVDGAMRWAAQ
jgi:hypothetical protein